MPPTILSSPLMNLGIINRLLSDPTLPPPERIKLLSLKIHLLVNPPDASPSYPTHGTAVSSASGSGPSKAVHSQDESPNPNLIEELESRLILSRLHLNTVPPGWVAAESELTNIDGQIKAILKRRRGRREARRNEEAEEGGKEIPEDGQEQDGSAKRSISTESRGSDSRDHQSPSNRVDPPWLTTLRRIRLEALTELIRVEEGLGREGKAKRWREMIATLENEES